MGPFCFCFFVEVISENWCRLSLKPSLGLSQNAESSVTILAKVMDKFVEFTYKKRGNIWWDVTNILGRSDGRSDGKLAHLYTPQQKSAIFEGKKLLRFWKTKILSGSESAVAGGAFGAISCTGWKRKERSRYLRCQDSIGWISQFTGCLFFFDVNRRGNHGIDGWAVAKHRLF